MSSGEFDAVLAEVGPDSGRGAAPAWIRSSRSRRDVDRADALAWKGDIESARRAVDRARPRSRHRETYSHGRLAMVGMRIEADAAVAGDAGRSLAAVEEAQSTAPDHCRRVERRRCATAELESARRCLFARNRRRVARLMGEGVVQRAHARGGSVRHDLDAVLRDVLSLARSRGDAPRRRPSDRNRGSRSAPAPPRRARGSVASTNAIGALARSPSAPARPGAHDGRRRRSPLRARARGTSPRGRRQVESGDRVDPLHQPPHGGGSRFEHPAQDERVIPRGSYIRSASPRLRLSNATQ